jgi:hypothetical protein
MRWCPGFSRQALNGIAQSERRERRLAQSQTGRLKAVHQLALVSRLQPPSIEYGSPKAAAQFG